MIDVVYLAAGYGKRAKLGYPKQFAYLGGKPIFMHALEKILTFPVIGKIFITFPESFNTQQVEAFNTSISAYVTDMDKIKLVRGGFTRQESVVAALLHVTTENVLIMESVRPFVSSELLYALLSCEDNMVVPWRPSKSSVFCELTSEFIDRSTVGEIQLPQKFNTMLLISSHFVAEEEGRKDFTDDAQLVQGVLGCTPTILLGDEENIKITTPLDLIIAEAIYNARHRDRE